MPQPHKPQPPPPEALKQFSIPGYLMPLLAEWLQVSVASLYTYTRNGKRPSSPVVARLTQEPYLLPPEIWLLPGATIAEYIYTRWYEHMPSNEPLNDEEEQILAQLLL